MNITRLGRWHVLPAAILLAAPFCHAQTHTPTCSGPGTERWPVKTTVPSGTDFTKAKKVAFNDLLALAQPTGVEHNDPRFQKDLIPKFSNSLDVREGDLIITAGLLFLVATETDCDYHIQISNQPRTTTDKPTSTDSCLIVEAPKPDFVQDADLKQKLSTLRDYIKAKVMHGTEPSNSGSVMVHSVCVSVTGALFYDDAHVGKNGQAELRGKRGMQSHTLWELHPMTDFQIVPSAQCSF